MAKIHEVPCIVVNDVDANSASVMSLIENIQRKDLNAIEEAQGLNELINQHNYTQESAGKIVGKSRVYITNSLRLLKLPEKILSLIKDNKLSAGHARLLIGREDAVEIAQIIIKDSLSVRDLEKLLKNFSQKKPLPNKIDPNIVSISKRLSDHLGLNVKIDFKEENQVPPFLQTQKEVLDYSSRDNGKYRWKESFPNDQLQQTIKRQADPAFMYYYNGGIRVEANMAGVPIYIDGKYYLRDRAKISVFDSGFLLGDGIWEGIRLVKNEWLFIDEHIDRLLEGCLAVDLSLIHI